MISSLDTISVYVRVCITTLAVLALGRLPLPGFISVLQVQSLSREGMNTKGPIFNCWIHVALRPAPIPPLFPPVLLVSLPIPRCALRSSWRLCALRSFWRPFLFPRASSGAPGVSWVLKQCSDSLVRPAAAAPFPGVLLPAVRWLSSSAVARARARA
jgi:hypothetical protein